MQSLQDFIVGGTLLINNTIIPFLFTLGLLFFIWNAYRFFIVGANDSKVKENAKNLSLYGIGAFVVAVSIWGLVNFLVSGLGLNSNNYVEPDYLNNSPSYNDPFYRENVRQAEYCRRNPNSLDCR